MQSKPTGPSDKGLIAVHKRQAEVMAACYCTIAEIGRVLKRPPITIRCWLIAASADKQRSRRRQWQAENKDKCSKWFRQWAEKNKEYAKQRWASYYAKNCERLRGKQRQRRLEDPEKCKRYCRDWHRRNKAKASAAYKAWKDSNIEKARQRTREWRALNPETSKLSSIASQAKRRTANRRALMGATPSQIRQRKKLFGECCAYCGASTQITIDHVLPIKIGGLDESSNLVPACRRCNSSKSAKLVEDWYKSQPFFSATRWLKICKYCPGAASSQLSIAVSR